MLLDILFPKTCLGCGRLGAYICTSCRSSLEFIQKDSCLYCKRINQIGLIHENCKRKDGLDGTLSIVYYNETARRIVKGIKYRLVRDAFNELFMALQTISFAKFYSFKRIYRDCLIQPVPLHPNRLRQRGFNQSLILALFFQSLLGYPIIDNLQRVKETVPQAQTSSRLERYLNIRRAFRVVRREEIVGRDIILVDDVLTSGLTAVEAATRLKYSGAKSVFLFTIAHG